MRTRPVCVAVLERPNGNLLGSRRLLDAGAETATTMQGRRQDAECSSKLLTSVQMGGFQRRLLHVAHRLTISAGRQAAACPAHKIRTARCNVHAAWRTTGTASRHVGRPIVVSRTAPRRSRLTIRVEQTFERRGGIARASRVNRRHLDDRASRRHEPSERRLRCGQRADWASSDPPRQMPRIAARLARMPSTSNPSFERQSLDSSTRCRGVEKSRVRARHDDADVDQLAPLDTRRRDESVMYVYSAGTAPPRQTIAAAAKSGSADTARRLRDADWLRRSPPSAATTHPESYRRCLR